MQFIGCTAEFAEADAAVFGAPFDSTTSYRPGARSGPAQMRAESFGIETYSPETGIDLEDLKICDAGDLELPPGSAELALAAIEAETERIAKAGKIPAMLGGEHLVTLGAVRALAKIHPDLRIIHFDAHADLREDYLGVKLSHACVMRRCAELLGEGRIFQFGIRSGTREEFAFAKTGAVCCEPLGDSTLREKVRELGDAGHPTYVTVDLDVLDPAEFPGTGTPEAGGFAYGRLIGDLRETFANVRVVGFDNVELAPSLDPTGRSTALACKLLREELCSLRIPRR